MPTDTSLEVKVPETQPVKEVVVDLDDKNQVVKPETSAAKKEEPKYFDLDQVKKIVDESVKKATAPLYYELRKSQTRQETIQPQIQPVTPAPAVPLDEWDKKVQTNWKGTVEELAELKFQELMRKQQAESQVKSEQERLSRELQESQAEVLKSHPEIADETSDKAQLFMKIIEEKPNWKYNPQGPLLVANEMERRLRAEGKLIDEPTKRTINKEVTRQTRVGAATVPNGTAPSHRSITLSADQKRFCDINGIKYENYARYSQMNSHGGVET